MGGAIELADVLSILGKYSNSTTDNFTIISVDESSLNDSSTGFLSIQGRYQIVYKENKSNQTKKLNIFVKKMPTLYSFHVDFTIETKTFSKEAQLYREVLEKFRQYTTGHPFPKYYLARENDVIVMEDMSSLGFICRQVIQPWDLQHCRITLKTMAQFHAASWAFEKDNNRKLNDIFPHLISEETFFVADTKHLGYKWLYSGIMSVEKVAETYFFDRYSKEVINKGHAFLINLPHKYKTSEIYPNVLNNGDMWGNNVMYRYDKSGSPVEACLIDFQLSRYVVPALDLVFFLHVNTNKQFRVSHFSDLLKYYYDCLANQLTLLDLKIESFLTWHKFEQMIKDTTPTVLAMVPIYLSLILLPDSKVHKMMTSEKDFRTLWYEIERYETVLETLKENSDYRTRLLESITVFYDYISSNES